MSQKVCGRAISEKTAQDVLSMMESVVAKGTGKNAKVSGFRVGGKTGTSEDGVNTNKYVTSFVGVAPISDPKVTILVTLYNPTGEEGHQGGAVAAPIAANIMENVLEHLNIPKDYSDTKDTTVKVNVPDVTQRTVGEATRMLTEAGLKYSVDTTNANAIVVSQVPAAGEILVEKSLVKLYLQGNDTRFNTIVPNIVGMDIVSATKTLSDANLNIKISGSGVVAYQAPPSGTSVEQGSVVRAEFRNQGIDTE